MRIICVRSYFTLFVVVFGAMACIPFAGAWGQEEAVEQSEIAGERRVSPPEPLDVYMGREIAATMHFSGAEWLIRDEREREERCSMMLASLGLQRGMTVCDMGCGNGFYSLQMAELLGDDGQVIAVDIQPQMLTLLRDRMEARGIDNVTPVLGSAYNPRLPVNSLDLVLMVDVYHEFSYPEEMLAAIRRGLNDDGLVVLVEYRAEDDEVPIRPEHKMTMEQVDREMEANGFERAKSFDKLPWQHMLFYRKQVVESGN
ncbi:MAG: class I SAM-dependent methyltransferase [Pirellulaceae bacterium]